MTFYQQLQLNQIGSKQLIKNAQSPNEKLCYIAIYLFKIFLTLAFCMAFVVAYSTFFGSDNSIVGVVILLFVMVFRNADLGIHTPHAIPSLLGIFIILAFGPRLAHTNHVFISLFIHLICIGTLMFLGCHNVIMSNHSTLVLGYLLLYGYDVSGTSYMQRLVGIAVGALLTCIVYYRNHHKKVYKRKFQDLFKEFNLHSSRTKWQVILTLSVASILFIAEYVQLPRAMWAGIAAMSILVPFREDTKTRVKQRILGNLMGNFLFLLIYLYCPSFIYDNIGIIGGIGVGLSASYGWQAVFNTFGALSIATSLFGLKGALFYRLFNNSFGAIYGLAIDKLFHKYLKSFNI